MTDRWACEDPEHDTVRDGERSRVHPKDRFTFRTTYYRADGKERLHERSHQRICRPCVKRRERGTDYAVGLW